MSCLAVTRALDVGATMIVAASSGNGGASLALYAAAAGLQCCIVTTSALSPVFRRAIIMTGAQIVTASDSLERWDHIANTVKAQSRSEERGVGKEGVRTCKYRWCPSHSKNKKQ